MKRNGFIFILLLLSSLLWAAGSAESSGSAQRGKYLAGRGTIIPPGEIYVDSYIAQINYKYPVPVNDLGITLYTGHKQVSAEGQEELIHIGIQGKEREFENLPPLNIAFVIDKSGSMAEQDKMDWVKKSFDIFINKVRDTDYVSLIIFDDQAKVLFKSTRMNTKGKRLKFQNIVSEISPGRGTNLSAGLELGYKEVLSNYRKEYTNRVLFLTDGMGKSDEILAMAKNYADRGINVSTIGLGKNFDVKLMRNLAIEGGGSSRFISDSEEMEKTFGSELGRMVVAAARNLVMELKLKNGVKLINTWGYQHTEKDGSVEYKLNTLHNGDYETIVAKVQIPKTRNLHEMELGEFSVKYEDLDGEKVNLGPYTVKVKVVKQSFPVAGYSDAMVLRSGTMLDFAQALISIGKNYYSTKNDLDRLNSLRNEIWREKYDNGESGIDYEDISNSEIQNIEKNVRQKMRLAINQTQEIKKELLNAKLRLDNDGFDDEIAICDKYLEILGRELQYKPEQVAEIINDQEIKPQQQDPNINENIKLLFREIALNLNGKKEGVIAIAGFSRSNNIEDKLIQILNENAIIEMSKLDQFRIVERAKLDEIMKEQRLILSELVDTENAIEIGRLSSADYILTGTVIEMPNSVIIFGRVINIENGEIESTAQIILNKNDAIKKLL